MRESFELPVGIFHLVVLRVEEHGLLDLINVSLVQNVDPNAELLDLEVRLESVADRVATRLIDVAVEDFEHLKRLVTLDQLSDGERSNFSKARVAELEDAQVVI